MWQTVITAAGNDDKVFQAADFSGKKNWLDYNGETILENAIRSHSAATGKVRVVLRDSEADEWNASKVVNERNNLEPVFVDQDTSGALCTALLGLRGLDLHAPLVVAPGDSFVDMQDLELVRKMESLGADAATLVFHSESPKYSYVRLAGSNRVSEIVEKRVISDLASTGFFYFRKASYLLQAAEWVLSKNLQTKGEFFMSSSLNYLIMSGMNVVALPIPEKSHYVRLATPQDLLREAKSSK